MKTYAFYHRETGEFHHIIVTCSSKAAVEQNTPPNHVALEHIPGEIHPQRHRYDMQNEKVIEAPRPPAMLDRPPRHPMSLQERLEVLEADLAKRSDAR